MHMTRDERPISATDTQLATYARAAGMLYLIIIVLGISSELFIRSSLIVADSPAQTAANILASPSLFRTGFAADTIMLLCDVAIAVLFYALLKPVSKTLALTAAVFRLIQASILGFNLLNYHAALLLLGGNIYTDVFTTDQLQALAMLFLDMHGHGYDLGLVFFSLSCLILGYLITRSNYLPALFGYGLIAAAMVYMAGSLVHFLSPDLVPLIQPAYLVPLVAELSFCLWLLVKGVRSSV